MVELAANNHILSSTEATPFFSNYSFHPRFTVTLKPHAKNIASPNAKIFALKMKDLHDHLQPNICSAQDQQEQAINAKRKPAPDYQIGDLVFLSAKKLGQRVTLKNSIGGKLVHFPSKK